MYEGRATIGEHLREAKELMDNARKVQERREITSNIILAEIKELHSEVLVVQEKQSVYLCTMRKEVKRLDSISTIATETKERIEGVRDMLEFMEVKESFDFTFVDFVKESERMTRQLYTRTFYASTICRQVASSAFTTLEGTMRMLQSLNARSAVSNAVTQDMMDNRIERISTNNGRSGIGAVLEDLLLKTRYLQSDILNMDQLPK